MGFVFLRGSLKVQYILHPSLSGRNSSTWADRDQLPKFLLQGFPCKQYKFQWWQKAFGGETWRDDSTSSFL